MMNPDNEDPELAARLREQALTLVQGIPRHREEQIETERSLVHNARRCAIGWDEIAAATGMSAGWIAAEKYGEPDE
jgi:hypothetical protein